MGTIQAFRVSLWITTSGRSDLWTTSSSLPVAEVYVPCRGCFVASAFLCVLSCARFLVRAGPVVCVDCSLRVGAARKSSPCSAKMADFRCFWACWASFFARGAEWGHAGRTLSRFGRGGTMQVLSCVHAGPETRVDWSLRVGSARKSSPCGVKRIGKREKVRPARQKWPIFGVFGLAGRVFSRFCQNEAAIGRTFSRFCQNEVAVG